jgi:biopolymer transport protein ExbD
MMPLAPDALSVDEPELMLEINTTPLIDVLLVLLVIFIITIPVQLHAVNMVIPTRAAAPLVTATVVIDIRIDASDQILWQGVPVSRLALDTRMTEVAQWAQPPALQLHADRASSYSVFAHVLAASRRQGLNQVAVMGIAQYR